MLPIPPKPSFWKKDTNILLKTADDVDFQKKKAIAMATDNGTTMPSSPVIGQKYIQNVTGRVVEYMYNGSNWIPQFSYGNIDVYVHSSGSDSLDKGTATGTDAYLTLQYALDSLPTSRSSGSIFTIHVSENYTENITVKVDCTIKSTLTTEDSGISCTNVKPVLTTPSGAYGTLTRSSGTWTASARKYLLAYDGTDYYAIKNNTTTVISHTNNVQGAGAKTVSTHGWTATIIGLITVNEKISLTLEDIKCTRSSTTSGYLNGTIVLEPYAVLKTERCSINQTGDDPVIYGKGYNKVIPEHSLYVGKGYCLRLANQGFVDSLYKNSGFVLTDASASKKVCVETSLGSSGYIREGFVYTPSAAPAGSIGISTSYFSLILTVHIIIDGFDTGIKGVAAGHGGATNSITAFLNCTTNKNPASASDPSYIT